MWKMMNNRTIDTAPAKGPKDNFGLPERLRRLRQRERMRTPTQVA